MRDEHIISRLESTSLASLGEADLIAIRTHTNSCPDCLQAYQAAQVSLILLKERVAAEFEPSPFFHTRVLAILRERQAANDSWAFGRMWRAAGALASSMAAAVALLAVFTFAVPENQIASQQVSPTGYSAEEVILEQTPPAEEVSDGQLLTTIYGGDEETSR
jgi:hypothetical protein